MIEFFCQNLTSSSLGVNIFIYKVLVFNNLDKTILLAIFFSIISSCIVHNFYLKFKISY